MDIPDEILNFEPGKLTKKKPKDSSKYIKEVKKSNFLISINPNISHRATPTPELRKQLALGIQAVANEINKRFSAGEWLKPMKKTTTEWKAPPLESYKAKLEIGSQIGFLHVHILASFDGTCHVDLTQLREFLNGVFKRKVHVQAKFFQNAALALEKYVEKTQTTSSSADPDKEPAQEVEDQDNFVMPARVPQLTAREDNLASGAKSGEPRISRIFI